jgi:hypothetical protein
MARLSWTQRLYWRYLSKPASQRAIFLHVINHPVASILEIGIGTGDRIKQVLSLCHAPEGTSQIRYAGVDAFESAGQGAAHITLKGAHRMLAELGVKAHLVPGEPSSALPRVAHSIMPSDLVIIDSQWLEDPSQMTAITQWLPRLCHTDSTIFGVASDGCFEKKPVPAPGESVSIRRAA